MQGQRVLTRDFLYFAIRDAVTSGELAPGARVTEVTLAEQFGMSRTPLREAIARLESEKLMIRLPNGALTIAPLDLIQLSEIYGIQERVEGLIVGALARMKNESVVQQLDLVLRNEEALVTVADFCKICEIDVQFHDIMWDSSHQNHAAEILRGFAGMFERYLRLVPLPLDFRTRLRAMHNEHLVIRNAIAEADVAWAEMAVKTHVRNSKLFLLAAYKSAPS